MTVVTIRHTVSRLTRSMPEQTTIEYDLRELIFLLHSIPFPLDPTPIIHIRFSLLCLHNGKEIFGCSILDVVYIELTARYHH